MWTRKQFMDGACSHRTYYAQFLTPAARNCVLLHFTMERLVANNIPQIEWDRLSIELMPMLKPPPGYSLDTVPYILKEAARQLVEEHAAA